MQNSCFYRDYLKSKKNFTIINPGTKLGPFTRSEDQLECKSAASSSYLYATSENIKFELF